MADRRLTLLRPGSRNKKPRPGEHLLKPIRQLIESVNDTLKGQLDLERHGARTPAESWPASDDASWPSQQPSGTTEPTKPRSHDHSSPTTTDQH